MKLLTFYVGLIMPYALAGQESSVNNKNLTAPFDLVITEILADPDPAVGLPLAEFVELYNRSTTAINLSGWNLFEGSNRLLPGMVVLPGEYVIICANSDTAKFLSFGKVAGVSSMSLTNTGEKVAIRNPQGIAIDSVVYADTWYGNSYKKDGGWTLERMDANFTCQLAANWKPSVHVNGGTPGAANSVAGVFIDSAPPILLRAYCTDTSSVMVLFSESLDPNSVGDLLNFEVSEAPQPINAEFTDASLTKVLIQLEAKISSNKIAFLSVKNIFDCADNMVDTNSFVRFGIPDTGMPKGIVINEVLFDPYEGGFDFVELYHNGYSIYDMSAFQIASFDLESGDLKLISNITEEPWLLFPRDYLVLSEDPKIVAEHYKSTYPYNNIAVTDLPSMNIDEGHIGILFAGQILDQFHYTDEMHFELIDDVKGISLEKINPARLSSDATAWHSAAASAGFATPGLRNSQFSIGNSNKTEVSVFPEIFSPDNDGYNDVVTFSIDSGQQGYISNITIYSSAGFLIYEFPKNSLLAPLEILSWNGITSENTIASCGIYIALVELFNLNGSVRKFRLPFVIAQKL